MTSVDVNDIFDSIALSENNLVESGYEKGYREGGTSNSQEGKHLGFQKGIQLGTEIGFYLGFAEQWSNHLKSLGKEDKKSLKAIAAFDKVITLSNEVPEENNKDLDLSEVVSSIRAKFKLACSLLKINPEFDFETTSW